MTDVLLVSTSTTVGGAEKTLYTVATLLTPDRFRVVGVVSLKSPGLYLEKLRAAGFPVFSLDMRERISWATIDRLRVVIAQTRPQLVVAFMYQAMQACRLTKWRDSPAWRLVTSPRVSYRTRSLASKLVDRFLKRADDMLIAESQATRGHLVGRMGYDPARVRVIYNGIDVAGWPASKLERRQKRLELRLGAEELLIGTAGRLDRQKGQGVLIAAMERLRALPLRCAILGEGPRRPELESAIRRRNLEKSVWLLGERQDMTAWLSTLDIFILPSLWEGLPNALLEAMALGLPVIASSVDGVPEAVADGRNGLLVPPGNPQALAAALRRLVLDPDLRSRLGAAARQTVAERFGLIRMMADYESALGAAVSGSARGAGPTRA